MAVVNKSSWRPYWRISPPDTLLLFYIDFFLKKEFLYVYSDPSLHFLTELHFWFACWHFIIKPAANFGFFSSSVLLTRLILTSSRNSYCLVHHLDSITRLLIILIVRERVRERESACHYSFLRLLSLQIVFNSDNLYNSMDHIPRSILMKMLTQGLTRGEIMNCGIYRI